MKRRILSIITALALCLSLCPGWARAADAPPADAVASVTIDGETNYYSTLRDAWNRATAEPDKEAAITLLENVDASGDELYVDETSDETLGPETSFKVTLHGGGYTVSNCGFIVTNFTNSSLTIDNCSFNNAGVRASSGTTTLTNCTGNVVDVIADGGTAKLTRCNFDAPTIAVSTFGEYSGDAAFTGCVFRDNAKVRISGGTASFTGGEIDGGGYDAVSVEGGTAAFDGCTISSQNDYAVYVNGGNAAFNGCTISSGRESFYSSGGTAEITDCTVTGGGYNVYVDGGDLTINSGTLQSTGEAPGCPAVGLFILSGTARLRGGTFSGATSAIGSFGGCSLAGLLGHEGNTRYAYFNGDTPITEGLDGNTLTGSVTVKPCTHAGQATDNGNGTHNVDCAACGLTATGEAHNWTENAPCTVCGAEAAVKIERADGTTAYAGESDAELRSVFKDNVNAGATFTLLKELIKGRILIYVDCTLDLNGCQLLYAGDCITVEDGVTATIRGEGKVGPGPLVVYSTAHATVKGGTYSYGNTIDKAVDIYGTEGSIVLRDLLGRDGDTFYAYYDRYGKLITEGLDGKTLTGSVTVKPCTHEGVCTYTHNENTSTHTKTCLACGKTWDAEDCDYGEYTHNDTSHTRICKLCGYQNVEAHNIKCTAEASGTVIAVSEACKTCGYGKDLGTVTIHIPKLVYGDLTGVVTAETTLTETVVVAVRVDNNPSGSTTIFPLEPPTMATLTGNALLSAGTHQIKIEIIICRNDNYLADCMLPFTVDSAPLTADMVTLGQTDVTYNGTEQKPALSVKQGETTLTEGTDYEVSYTRDGVVTTDFTNAGTVNITVTGKGNYTGSVEKTYTIGKATPTIAWANNVVTLTYTGQPADIKPVVTLVNGETFSGTITYHHTNTDSSESGESKAGLPTNAGIYVVGARIPEQDNYTAAATAFLMLTINKADQTVPAAPTADEENIKDTSITLDTIENAEYKRDDGEWQDSPVFTDLSPNTPYTFYARLKEDANHNASPDSAAASITTKKTMLNTAVVTVSGTYTYTGAAIVPETGNVEVVLNGTKIDSDQYTISASNNINAGVGKATLTVTATETGNYSGSVSSTFTINRADLTVKANDQTITYGGSIATGTDQVTPAGLVGGDTLESVTLEASSDQVAVADKTITPSAAVIKRGGEDAAANYNITYQPGALTINKAQAAVTGNPTANTLTYTGAAQALVTTGTASVGEVVYSLTETGTYSTTIPTGTDAGSYTVWYKVEGTTNYEGTDPMKVDVTIAKVNYTGEKAGSTSGKFGMTKTYNLANLLPEGYVLGTITVTDTNSIFDGTPTVSGTTLTYKLAESAEVGKTGTITIPVTESTNYNSFDLTITVTVTNVRIPDLTVNPISVTYTGNPVNSNQITGTATVDGNTVLGTWSFAEGQALTNVADSGPKSVVFNPTDTDEYGPATGTVTVTIRKATPSLTLTPSPATLPNGGTVTLTLSGLPGGSATVTCSDTSITVAKGSGNTWTADLPAGGASYAFTASYAGDGNHNGATASCTVSVEKITPRLSLTAAPAALRGGGAVTLTLSGLPAGGTATVSCSSGITVTAGAGSTWTATLPNSTATYTFTASYAGNASYHGASATCTVETTEVTVLPNPPEAEDGKQYQVVMEDGISEVPAGLQSIETLNTPEKLETTMKTAITQANSGVPQANTAVYDVELQISTDGGATWTKATAANFPANGLTVTLPYPAGTNSSYTFTVVHMFTTSDFGKTPGDTEMPRVTNTASGLQFTVSGLSPISVGWEQPKTPVTPPTPSGGGGGGGGGWSSSTYAVTVERAEHGKVTSNRTNASSGSTVTLTATPDSGYVLDTLTVTDSRGNEIRLTAQGGGKYTFTMPSRAVTVKATFAPLPDDTEKPCDGGVDCPSHGFTDLGTVGTWYHEAVDYVLRNNLMGGYGNGLFGPNDTLTRAQFAQILYNKEGRPAVTGGGIFTDVAPGVWCAPAITWAAERGIVGGYGNGMFGPNDNITREQLAVMLWRYAGTPAATEKELHFNDADKASGYALDALRWAVENGVINGKGGGILDPKGLATRAQTAQMLKNFLGK